MRQPPSGGANKVYNIVFSHTPIRSLNDLRQSPCSPRGREVGECGAFGGYGRGSGQKKIQDGKTLPDSNPGDIPRAQSARQQVYLPTQRRHSASGTVNFAPVRAKGAQGDDVFGFHGEKSQRKKHALWRGFRWLPLPDSNQATYLAHKALGSKFTCPLNVGIPQAEP